MVLQVHLEILLRTSISCNVVSLIKLDKGDAEEYLTEKKKLRPKILFMKEDIEGWEVILIIISNIKFGRT